MKKVFVLFLAFLLANCQDRNSAESGDNTLSCDINGKLFVPKYLNATSASSYKGLSINRANNGKDLEIYATNKTDNTDIYIYVKDFSLGSFELSDSNGSGTNINNSQATVIYNSKKYLSKSGNSGSLIITTLTSSDVKGTFFFKLFNENDPSDVIDITNGKFDD